MKAFLMHLYLQFKLGLRDKTLLIDFYIVPLGFYLIMGGVMSGINPLFKHTLITSMIIFAVTMGGLMGVAEPLSRLRENGTLRSYRVMGIPECSVLLTDVLGTFLHLMLVSVIILVTAPIFFKADNPKNYLLFFAVLALYILTTIAVGLLFGVLVRPHMATMLSTVVFVFSVMLSGMMFQTSLLPKSLMYLGRILPATYADQGLSGLSFGLSTNIDSVLSVTVLACICIFCGMFCTIRFIIINRESV